MPAAEASSSKLDLGLPPHVWIYDQDGFKNQIGEDSLQRFKRRKSETLRALIHSDDVYAVPHGDASHFYLAQLLHYGLLPTNDVKIAVDRLKAAYTKTAILKPPARITSLREALKHDYEQRQTMMQDAKLAELKENLERTEAEYKQKMDAIRSQLDAATSNKSTRKQLKEPDTVTDSHTTTDVHDSKKRKAVAPPEEQRACVDMSLPSTGDGKMESTVGARVNEAETTGCPALNYQAQPNSAVCKRPRTSASNPVGSAIFEQRLFRSSFPVTPVTDPVLMIPMLIGRWKVRQSTGADFSRHDSWIGFAMEASSDDSATARGIVGHLMIDDFDIYFAASNLPKDCQMIGHSMKTTFRWRGYAHHALSRKAEQGKLEIFFSGSDAGCKIDGYLSEGNVEGVLAFEGYSKIGDPTQNTANSVAWTKKYRLAVPPPRKPRPTTSRPVKERAPRMPPEVATSRISRS